MSRKRQGPAQRAGGWAVYALMRLFRAGTGWLAVHRLSAMLAPLGGWLALAVPGIRRRAASNIALVWPEMRAADRRRLVREAGASAEYLDKMAVGLENWVKAADDGHLAWGVQHFRKPA